MPSEAPLYRFCFRAELTEAWDTVSAVPSKPSDVEATNARSLARLSLQPELHQAQACGQIHTASLFLWEQRALFLYVEAQTAALQVADWLPSLQGHLCLWPGSPSPRRWVEMTNVFHFNRPTTLAQWQTGRPAQKRLGKVAFLRPEKIASYIYYHYQLQEEQAFQGEKYKFICLHENLLFMYDERPEVIETASFPPSLKTHGTPSNWADSHMEEHFQHWSPTERFFREIQEIASVG